MNLTREQIEGWKMNNGAMSVNEFRALCDLALRSFASSSTGTMLAFDEWMESRYPEERWSGRSYTMEDMNDAYHAGMKVYAAPSAAPASSIESTDARIEEAKHELNQICALRPMDTPVFNAATRALMALCSARSARAPITHKPIAYYDVASGTFHRPSEVTTEQRRYFAPLYEFPPTGEKQ